jgi:hypothetical protein
LLQHEYEEQRAAAFGARVLIVGFGDLEEQVIGDIVQEAILIG